MTTGANTDENLSANLAEEAAKDVSSKKPDIVKRLLTEQEKQAHFMFYGNFLCPIYRLSDKAERYELLMALIEFGCFGEKPNLEDEHLAAIFDQYDFAICNQMKRKIVNSQNRIGKTKNNFVPSSFSPNNEQERNVTTNNFVLSADNEKNENAEIRNIEIGNSETRNSEMGNLEKKKDGNVCMKEESGGSGEPQSDTDKSSSFSSSSSSKNGFTPPTVEEVRAYFKEIGKEDESQKFVDFYESKGWLVGKSKMKDWRASVRTWETRQKTQGAKYSKNEYADSLNNKHIADEYSFL